MVKSRSWDPDVACRRDTLSGARYISCHSLFLCEGVRLVEMPLDPHMGKALGLRILIARTSNWNQHSSEERK